MVDIGTTSVDVRRWIRVFGSGHLTSYKRTFDDERDSHSRVTELVIFDCDGVLIDSELISAQTLITLLSDLGIDIDSAFVRQHFLGRSFPTVARFVDDRFAVKLPDSFEKDYRQQLLVNFETDLRLMKGVGNVLDQLCVPYCLATSSSPERTERALRLTGVFERFENRIFTASEVVHGKPAPDLFLHAARRMQILPERCLVIEDSIVGLQAGVAAGMPVLRFTGGSHLADLRDEASNIVDAADLVVPQFSKFDDFFDLAPDLKTMRVANTNGE